MLLLESIWSKNYDYGQIMSAKIQISTHIDWTGQWEVLLNHREKSLYTVIFLRLIILFRVSR